MLYHTHIYIFIEICIRRTLTAILTYAAYTYKVFCGNFKMKLFTEECKKKKKIPLKDVNFLSTVE